MSLSLRDAMEMAEALTTDNEQSITSLHDKGDEVAVLLYIEIIDLTAQLSRANETIEVVAAQRARAIEAVEVKTVHLEETTRKMWQLDAQLTEALEAVEKLREAIIDTARFLKAHQDKTDGELYTIGKLEEALTAEPATVELPKCDHCGAIGCGTDYDESSHYTPNAAKIDVRAIAPDEFPEPGME